MKISTHELAKRFLKLHDMPVAVGYSTDIYQAGVCEFRIKPNGELLFDKDKPVKGEMTKDIFWLSQMFL